MLGVRVMDAAPAPWHDVLAKGFGGDPCTPRKTVFMAGVSGSAGLMGDSLGTFQHRKVQELFCPCLPPDAFNYSACAVEAPAVDRVCTGPLQQCCIAAEWEECLRLLRLELQGIDPVATAGTVDNPDLALKACVLKGPTPARSRRGHFASFRSKPHGPVKCSTTMSEALRVDDADRCRDSCKLLLCHRGPAPVLRERTRSCIPRRGHRHHNFYRCVRVHRQLVGLATMLWRSDRPQ